MKTPYEELELEVIRFKTEDIITTSAVNNPVPQQPTDLNDGGGNEPSEIPSKYVYFSTEYVEGLEGEVDIYRLYGEDTDTCYVFIDGERITVINMGDHYKA